MKHRLLQTEQGGLWVLGQFAMMAVCAGLGLIWSDQWGGYWYRIPAWLGFLCGATFGISGVSVLGRNRTAYPEPRPDSVLIQHGIYRHVRHPLYASLMWLAVGWGFWCRSLPALIGSIGLIWFLVFKAQNEESRLLRRFPAYAAYRRATRRFIPWIF